MRHGRWKSASVMRGYVHRRNSHIGVPTAVNIGRTFHLSSLSEGVVFTYNITAA